MIQPLMQEQFGLVAEGANIPLRGIEIRAFVRGSYARVVVRQRYENASSFAVEAKYVFPIDEAAAVTGFRADWGGRTVVGEIDDSDSAFERYDDALADGDGAILLDQERDDVFAASVGNLKPGEEATIEISYVTTLEIESGAYRFQLPTTVAPRYAPPTIDPEVAEGVDAPRASRVPYGFSLEIEVRGAGPLAVVESPSHPLRVENREDGAKIDLGEDVAALDGDFVLLFRPREATRPLASIVDGPHGEQFACVDFFPEVPVMEESAVDVWFLLDCSGSMAGESIDQAKRALDLCIRSLSTKDTFNIVRFGSSHQRMVPNSTRVTDSSLASTRGYLAAVNADLGGTEILSPLQDLLAMKPAIDRQRWIVVLTDGQVMNEREVIQHVRKNRGETRILSFAIGRAASQYLVKGLAREGRGEAETIHPGERIEPKVLRTFGRMRSPRIEKVSLGWGNTKVTTAHDEFPPIFQGEPIRVLARVDSERVAQESQPSVTLKIDGQKFRVDLDVIQDAESPIPQIWARERLRVLERDVESPRGGSRQKRRSEESARDRLVEFSKRYGVTCSVTSFVGVVERTEDEKNDGPEMLVRVPLQIPRNSTELAAPGGWAFASLGSPNVRSRFAVAGAAAPPPAAAAPLLPPSPTGGGLFSKVRSMIGGARSGAALSDRSRGGMRSFDLAERGGTLGESQAGSGDELYDVLLSQTASGGFTRSVETLDILAAWAEDRGESLESCSDLEFTQLVLAWFRDVHASRSDEWSAAVRKAESWLQAQGVGSATSPH